MNTDPKGDPLADFHLVSPPGGGHLPWILAGCQRAHTSRVWKPRPPPPKKKPLLIESLFWLVHSPEQGRSEHWTPGHHSPLGTSHPHTGAQSPNDAMAGPWGLPSTPRMSGKLSPDRAAP